MIFRKTLIGLFFLVLTLSSFSQADTLVSRGKVSSSLKGSFNGSLIYPGAGLGIEFPVYSIVQIKNSDQGNIKKVLKDRFVSLNAAWYHHKDFHDNLYFTAEWIMRRTHKSGFFTEFNPGLGYSRTFLGGTTYKVSDNGTVSIVKSAGYSYAVAKAGGGLGYSFLESRGIPLSVYYNLSMLTMFPYNSTIYFRPVMQLGVIFRPDNFIPRMIKKKIVNK